MGRVGLSFGGDAWFFSANGNRLVDTIFSNVSNSQDTDPFNNAQAFSPQRYTDANYASPTGPNVVRFTGADTFFRGANPNSSVYSDLYAIYSFGRGAGNPGLNFTASGTTATLQWARYSGTTDSADESWSLDNVTVSTEVASPAAVPLPSAGVGGLILCGLLAAKRATERARRTGFPAGA